MEVKDIPVVDRALKKEFKAHDAPIVELIECLIGKGYRVKVYDRNVSLSNLHGANRATLDIKRGGVGAIVEIARVLALSVGSRAGNTQTRIAAAVDSGALSAERGQDLHDAFEFISYVRLRHQAAQVRADRETDNFVAPDDLSSFEKRHLREAFAIVRSAQSSLSHRYPSTYVS